MSFRRTTMAAVAITATVALAGCGSNSSGAGAGTGSSGTAGGSTQQSTSAGLTPLLTAADFGTKMADAQRAAKTTHFTVSVKSGAVGAVHLSGDASVGSSLSDLAMDIKLDVPGKGPAEVRLVHSQMYIKGGLLPISGGKKWIGIDLSDPNNPLSSIVDNLMGAADPAHVAKLYASVTKLTPVGSEVVDGVTTEHYRVTINTAAALKAGGLGKAAAGGQAFGKLPKTMTTDVWLDANSRPVMTKSSIAGFVTVARFSKWGVPVTVSAPPSSQVKTVHLPSSGASA